MIIIDSGWQSIWPVINCILFHTNFWFKLCFKDQVCFSESAHMAESEFADKDSTTLGF